MIPRDTTGPPDASLAAEPFAASAKEVNNEGKKSGAVVVKEGSIAADPEEEALDDDDNGSNDEETLPFGQGGTEESHDGIANSNQLNAEEGGDGGGFNSSCQCYASFPCRAA